MAAYKKFLSEFWNFFLIALIILAIFFLQYTFRFADDNRLTRWEWAFATVDMTRFIGVFVAGIIAAYFISRIHFLYQIPSLFLFLFAFGTGMVSWSEPEVIVDSSRYFTQAKHLELYGIKHFIQEWGKGIFAWTDLPLVSFLYGMVFKFSGESRLYIQIFTTSLFALTSVLVYLTGRTLWDKETGFLAGVLLSGMPYLFSQIPLMLVDVPTMFFVVLSVFAFIKAMGKGGVWLIFSSAAIFCTVFSKYSAWMMLTVLPVIWLVYLINCRGNPLWLPKAGTEACPYTSDIFYRGISVFFIAGMLSAIVILLKYEVIIQQLRFLQEYQAPGLKRWGESFVSTFLFQVHPIITISALYSVFEAVRRRDLKFVIVSWLILLIILLQVRRSRYVLVIFPMLSLMASYGLQRIKAIELRRFVAFSAVSAALVVSIMSYLPFLQKMSVVNIKDAGEILNSVHTDEVRVFAIPSDETIVNLAVTVPVLDLFTEKKISYRKDTSYSPSIEEIRESPLRFTWEFKNPGYYEDQKIFDNNVPVVVISNGDIGALPGDIAELVKRYTKKKVFDTSDDLFTFNPFVTVYLQE